MHLVEQNRLKVPLCPDIKVNSGHLLPEAMALRSAPAPVSRDFAILVLFGPAAMPQIGTVLEFKFSKSGPLLGPDP
jgi:hypothetical protein